MNERDEELARSIDPDAWRQLHKDDEDWCKRFAELVRADERRACLCCIKPNATPMEIAAAIRARGNHEQV